MHRAQRILLAISCLLCFALFKRLWDSSPLGSLPSKPSTAAIGRDNSKSNAELHAHQQVRIPPASPACADLPGIEDLAIILKTGSTEIYEKLPIHFRTTFTCVADYLIYSDVQQDFAGVPIRDALALVSEKTRSEFQELHQYKFLNEHVRLGGDAADLKGDRSWRIDKWKFLPMISDAYLTFGDSKKWYFFIEADTYVSFHNLLPWLSKLDPKKPIYAGAQVSIAATEFAHGGSGFLLSAPAAKALSETYLANQTHWEAIMTHECCGDMVMAQVLLAATPSIRLLRTFPLIQGETLSSLDWSTNHWCRPAITWHHVDAAGIDKLQQFEARWRAEQGVKRAILFKHYFAAFIHPRLLAAKGTLSAWDNLSDDWSFPSKRGGKYHIAVETAWACEQFCTQTPDCLQWAWMPGSCKAGKKVRLGWALERRPKMGSAEGRIEKTAGKRVEGARSGWVLERIDRFVREMDGCDERDFWVTKNV